jgi:hypothetical protein
MRRFLKILLITIGVVAIGALGVFGWLAYKVSAAAQRRDELLKDFVQVSDNFTLPKVYQHKTFARRYDLPAQLSVSSDGRLTNKTSPGSFKLSINHQGTIVEDAIGRSGFIVLVERLCSLKPEEVAAGEIKCRFMRYGDRTPQDITLQGEDMEALIRTFELAECFHWNLW